VSSAPHIYTCCWRQLSGCWRQLCLLATRVFVLPLKLKKGEKSTEKWCRSLMPNPLVVGPLRTAAGWCGCDAKPAGGGSSQDCCSLVRLSCRYVAKSIQTLSCRYVYSNPLMSLRRYVYSNPPVVAIKWLLLVGASITYLSGSRLPMAAVLVLRAYVRVCVCVCMYVCVCVCVCVCMYVFMCY